MHLEYKGNKLIDFSFKLNKIHRAALPNAVRFTLTDAAKDVKFKTLIKSANKFFDVKKRNFFRAFSAYKPATGFDISKMASVAGMTKGKSPTSKSVASTEIGQQQFAGTIENKSFMPAKNQKTPKGTVKKAYKDLRKIKPIVTKKGKSFFPDVEKARKTNTPLLIKKNNKGILVKVGKSKKKLKTTPIASYEKDRKINLVKARPFLNYAAKESGKKLNTFFKKNAEKQIARFLR